MKDYRSPDHYRMKSLEAMKIIQVMTEDLDPLEAYLVGSMIKYLYRYRYKGEAQQDVNKAAAFAKMLVEKLERENHVNQK